MWKSFRQMIQRGRQFAKQVLRAGIPPEFVEPLADRGLLGLAPSFRELRLRLAHDSPGSTQLYGKRFSYLNARTHEAQHEEIIRREIYRFKPTRDCPLIVDCGANTGVSAAYFSRTYPTATIIAFEPDPRIHDLLVENLTRQQAWNVVCRRQAIWFAETELTFRSDGNDGGRIDAGSENDADVVSTFRLKTLLQDNDVDFLKMDIEGAEVDVLADCCEDLNRVQNLFVEFHSVIGQPQRLTKLLGTLESAGFRMHIENALTSRRPFESRRTLSDFDMLLQISAFRE